MQNVLLKHMRSYATSDNHYFLSQKEKKMLRSFKCNNANNHFQHHVTNLYFFGFVYLPKYNVETLAYLSRYFFP